MRRRNKEYWGSAGAGIIPLARSTGRFLIPLRSWQVMEPHTYGTIGGKLDRIDMDDEYDPDDEGYVDSESEPDSERSSASGSEYEEPEDAAVREFYEETGYDGPVDLFALYVFSDGNFRYYNFLGVIEDEFDPDTNWETDEWVWVRFDELLKLRPKHFGLESLLNDNDSRMVLKRKSESSSHAL
jgi:8-oxo-dGTP pyrophosphatase MutT (NUDIX family)